MNTRLLRRFRIVCILGLFSAGVAEAQPREPLVYREAGPRVQSRLHTGQVIELDTETVTKPFCGSDLSKITVDDLRQMTQRAKVLADAHPYRQPAANAVAGAEPPHFDLVFNVTTSLPSGAAEALAEVEHYVEGQFSNPITVVINFAFLPLGAGVLGSTSSNYTNVLWPTARTGLQTGMDPDDTIQLHLPASSTIPVRYDETLPTVTNETRVFVTFANYNATIGTLGGTVASMQFNTQFTWDYTPPSITPGAFCFRSVITHEVGHALGFTSGVDFRTNDMEMLDLYRFQRTDGTGNYNPDTLTDFETTPRLVDRGLSPNADNSNSDLISVEYQMADGNPSSSNQASHFHAQNPGIYIMDPSLNFTETFHSIYYRSGDRNMLDAIGWKYPLVNQSCPDAAATACGSTRYMDNVTIDSFPDPQFSCRSANGQIGTLWYSFAATHTSARISTCGSVATDTILAVYDGSCGSLTEIACSNDAPGCGASGLHASVCATGLTPGNTYYIQVASNNFGTRGIVALNIACSCDGACCLNPPASCIQTNEDACAQLGGAFAGPALVCGGDLNSDGVDEVCQTAQLQRSQLITANQEDLASNFDWSDNVPAASIVDDFVGDGRPVQAVRWWGSTLDDLAPPDGWVISLHEPLADGSPSGSALGVYFCASNVVTQSTMPTPGCDAHPVNEYFVELFNCCLLQANPDSRTTLTPAEDIKFETDLCADYEIGIQAVVGVRYDAGGCAETLTAGAANGDFWGWHSTTNEIGAHAALTGSVAVSGGDWQYGPWANATNACGAPNMAFELITRTASSGLTIFWHNGNLDNSNALLSQYGGQVSDALTADDIDIDETEVINEIHWFADENTTFTWSGRTRVEIYPDTGSVAPDETNGPTVALWIPDDGGAVTRTVLGTGIFASRRVRYDATGLNIPLAAGRWWIGLATAGTGTQGTSFWLTSHRQGVSTLFFGGESRRRIPSGGVPTFQPWSNFTGGLKYDMAFSLTTTRVTDCNCNGISDDLDILPGGGSSDCNLNTVPDECDPDCNSNGVPDDCDIPLGNSQDCQLNGVPDECDIFFGTSVDANHNGEPDECCFIFAPPSADPSGIAKNRFLTVVGSNPGRMTAIRVKLVSLQHPDPANLPQFPAPNFTSFEGGVRWVGPPSTYPESETSAATFQGAQLQCTPHFMDWNTVGTLQIFGSAVVPSSLYQLQTIDQSCSASINDEASFSAPLAVTTQRWGDVASPFQAPSPASLSQPNISDIAAVIDKFKDLPTAQLKSQTQLQPNVPNPALSVNIADVVAAVDGFKLFAYTYTGPTSCP